MSDTLQPQGLQHARPPCPSPTSRVYSNSCPLSRWCHPTISSFVIPFSSHLQSFPASRSFEVKWSRSVLSDSLRPHGLQYARPPCPWPTTGPCSNSCPLSRWCHPTISSSVVPFSSCLQSFPAPGSFPMNQFFASGGKSIGASASASVLPMNIQNWLVWLFWQSKGLSRAFSNTTVQKQQFFGAQPKTCLLCSYIRWRKPMEPSS